MARQSAFEAHSELLPQGKSLTLSEIGDPGPIELTSDLIRQKDIELEAFMCEPITIIMQESGLEGDLAVETPSVNGVNMPIVRGLEQTVKRKYVEALCQSRVITYVQEQRNPSDPSDIRMVERSMLKFPFVVTHDPNPKGRAWLKAKLEAR